MIKILSILIMAGLLILTYLETSGVDWVDKIREAYYKRR